jgi:hypothetical protein
MQNLHLQRLGHAEMVDLEPPAAHARSSVLRTRADSSTHTSRTLQHTLEKRAPCGKTKQRRICCCRLRLAPSSGHGLPFRCYHHCRGHARRAFERGISTNFRGWRKGCQCIDARYRSSVPGLGAHACSQQGCMCAVTGTSPRYGPRPPHAVGPPLARAPRPAGLCTECLPCSVVERVCAFGARPT